MKVVDFDRIYFLGIGGIGMSALARYFKSIGKDVAGYDHVSTALTDQLLREGMDIHFDDNISLLPEAFRNTSGTLVVYTPAIPVTHPELNFFREKGFEMHKRSQVLGQILKQHKGIAIAGTHGKTTISSMIAHIFNHSGTFCNAFLGGIAKNFNSNLVTDKKSDIFIVEADEFDRSFLTLFPDYAVVSSLDDDHLDIYGDRNNLVTSFNQFINQIKRNGILIIKKGVDVSLPQGIKIYRYSLSDECDYFAYDLIRKGMFYTYSIHTPFGDFADIELGVPGRLNIENSVAAFAITQQAGIDTKLIIESLKVYKGVLRRFDVQINTEKTLYIDDYAHHPEELRAFISSVKEVVPGKRLTGIFQPHLFSRTRDFAMDFSRSLSLLTDVILLDIYPAREKPIQGVSSKLIYDNLKNKGDKIYCTKEQLFRIIEQMNPEVLLSMGAGDIDKYTEPLKQLLIRINE